MSLTEPEPGNNARSGLRSDLRWWMILPLFFGLVLRLWFVWRLSSISDDSRMYGDIAKNLLTHHVYGLSNGGGDDIRATLVRLPGYPLFLAACFRIFGLGKFGPVMLTQVAMDLWTCLLLAATARRLFDARAGIAALSLGCLCPFLANYVAAPLTETPTLFCMALAFYSFARWQETGGLNRWLPPLGFSLAWAIMLRPEQGMLAAVMVPAVAYVSWREHMSLRARLQPALALSLLTLLPLIPWTARNWQTFHVIQPLAPRYANDPEEMNPYGFQRWYRTWAVDFASTEQVYWRFDGEPIYIADLPSRAFDSPEELRETADILDDYNRSTTPTPALDARFARLAGERVRAHPVRYFIALPVARLLNMVLHPRVDNLNVPLDWWNFRTHPGWSSLATAYGLLNLCYVALAAYALRVRAWQTPLRVLVWAMCGSIVFRCALLLTVDNSEPRYTLEFYPALVVLGGSALATAVIRLNWRRSASRL